MQDKYVIYKSSGFHSRRQRVLGKRIRNLIFFLLSLLFIFYISGFIIQKLKTKNEKITIISPLAEGLNASVKVIKDIVNPSELPEVVKKSLEGTRGTYAVAIKNLKTQETYFFNENREFQTASLYKLWVMAIAYRQIEAGKLDPDKILVRDIADLNSEFNIATDEAELTEGTLELDVKRAINQMITVSNNYAGLALVNEVGVNNIKKFLKDEDLLHSHDDDIPDTSAADIALFYEKLYLGQLAGKDSTAEMINILKSQQINDRLPKYLPENIDVAHKTGELDNFKHDAGIVFSPKGDYILVILSESDDSQAAAEREAQLSKAIYEYFEKRQ